MPDVQQIEHAVGEDDGLAGRPEALDKSDSVRFGVHGARRRQPSVFLN